jgi:S1-C subfamily serine protease
MTAKHVIYDFADRYGHATGGMTTVHANVWLVHVYPGPATAVWQVDQVWMAPHTDIAFMHTKPINEIADKREGMSPILQLSPPAVGDRISAFGYRESRGTITHGLAGSQHLDITNVPTAAVGEVIEVYMRQRDGHTLAFPSFRINARIDGGMSGGPLLNDRGCVCGVICASLPAQSEDEPHVSYGATAGSNSSPCRAWQMGANNGARP